MNPLLLQIVAVTTSALLTLPAGWCSGLRCDRVADAAPAKAICCQSAGHGQPQDAQADPERSSGDCCCRWQATVPQSSQQLDPASGFSFPPLPAHLAFDTGRPLASHALVAPIRSGPRLHVLHCIWRC